MHLHYGFLSLHVTPTCEDYKRKGVLHVFTAGYRVHLSEKHSRVPSFNVVCN